MQNRRLQSVMITLDYLLFLYLCKTDDDDDEAAAC
jgi:hypothetical protein